MIRIIKLAVPLDYDEGLILTLCAERLKIPREKILKLEIEKRSTIKKDLQHIHFEMDICLSLSGDETEVVYKNKDKKTFLVQPETYEIQKTVPGEHPPVVIGSGPAGLFAALVLAEAGLNPLLIERGSAVEERKELVEAFWRTGKLNEETNVQFGEGGAGTFSDGKLKLGKKDSRKKMILQNMVRYGAPEEILYLEKPHIGTDRLMEVVKGIRKRIEFLGGSVKFHTMLTGLSIKEGSMDGIYVNSYGVETFIKADQVILAIGHSAHDTFEMLLSQQMKMEPKPMAIGVRIEHPQELIDQLQYGASAGHKALGAADYKMVVHLENGRAVYTFCMCPGGQVVASASESGGVVTNGMSVFSRDGENANTALLVTLQEDDFKDGSPLAGVHFRREIEKAAFLAGGGNYFAPVQRLGDFMEGKATDHFGTVQPTYRPGTRFAKAEEYLPSFIVESLREALKEMGEWMPGYLYEDALITGAETRSSSPLRMIRDEELEAEGISGLYPCGEGAGYAGGIISAAVDGVFCAEKILLKRMTEA